MSRRLDCDIRDLALSKIGLLNAIRRAFPEITDLTSEEKWADQVVEFKAMYYLDDADEVDLKYLKEELTDTIRGALPFMVRFNITLVPDDDDL